MIILAYVLSGISFLLAAILPVKVKPPSNVMMLKMIAESLSPFWAVAGAAGALIGWAYQAAWAIPVGAAGAAMMTWYVWRVTRNHDGFTKAFGRDWADQIRPEQTRRMVQKRWSWFLPLKAAPEPRWERDVPFWTIPGTDRQLLCDIWQPAGGPVSGLTYIYFHGSGWTVLDKDFGTRPFFRHLVAQGHTVMDVSYRLLPETDMFGMIGDAKRAVAWMKANAARFGVDPDKIVLGGGSAGGHLALMAAYTPRCPELTPADVPDADLSVCGVISFYGPSDLAALYKHYMGRKYFTQEPAVPIGTELEPKMKMRIIGRLDMLLGGHLHDIPEVYQLASPIAHVNAACPPTLLVEGEKDGFSPTGMTQALYTKLIESGVPAVYVTFPWTEHGFDLLFPQVCPPAQAALYDVDRFLALLANKDSNLKLCPVNEPNYACQKGAFIER